MVAVIFTISRRFLQHIEAHLKYPWDFEEVYEKFYDFAKRTCFHEEKTRYYIHMSTGSHIEEKTYRPLGAKADEHSDFQLICGTNTDLAAATNLQPSTFNLFSATTSPRSTDRLSKYLARFGLKFKTVTRP